MHTIEGRSRLIIDKSPNGKVTLRLEIELEPLQAVEASMVLTSCARKREGR